jgi:hypothetical protein
MDRNREERGWRRHGEFDGGRYMDHHRRGGDGEFRGPGMRQRTEWTPAAPQGAERL